MSNNLEAVAEHHLLCSYNTGAAYTVMGQRIAAWELTRTHFDGSVNKVIGMVDFDRDLDYQFEWRDFRDDQWADKVAYVHSCYMHFRNLVHDLTFAMQLRDLQRDGVATLMFPGSRPGWYPGIESLPPYSNVITISPPPSLKMKTVLVTDMTDTQLDAAAALALGANFVTGGSNIAHLHWPSPKFGPQPKWSMRAKPYTKSWTDTGPIMESEGIFPTLTDVERGDDDSVTFTKAFRAKSPAQYLDHDRGVTGPTPLIAAVRCFILSKLGESVELPEDLA